MSHKLFYTLNVIMRGRAARNHTINRKEEERGKKKKKKNERTRKEQRVGGKKRGDEKKRSSKVALWAHHHMEKGRRVHIIQTKNVHAHSPCPNEYPGFPSNSYKFSVLIKSIEAPSKRARS